MRRIHAIDPGSEESGFVSLDIEAREVFGHDILPNEDLRDLLRVASTDAVLAVEWVTSYGMPVGAEVFNTCCWVGRFIEAFDGGHVLIPRREVKLHLCNSARAKDANVRQVVIDRYGGTREKAIGTKKNPGPLYGIRSHEWQAMGVALTWLDRKGAA